MAMNTNNLCLVSAMDRLWYHQIILWSDPLGNSHDLPNFVDTTNLHFMKFPSCPSPPPLPFSPLMDETVVLPSSSPSSSVSSSDISLVSQEDYSNDEDKDPQTGKNEYSIKESLNHLKFSERRKMNRSISCKSLGELELEEVKGFMDLGFEFKREDLSPQMVKLLPGLQRLKTQMDKQNLKEEDNDDNDNDNDNEENDNDKMKRDIARPYLSEAWTIKRPNSPLLNLRMPKFSSTSDMKKHLKSWAKTVAHEIQ